MKKRISWISIALMVVLALSLAACGPAATPEPTAVPTAPPEPTAAPPEPTPVPTAAPEEAGLEGKLIAFHAGSLTVPMDALTQAFQAKHPDVTFETEASGSNEAARKISELDREADLMLSADYTVIDKLLIPDFADWNIQFARNTMVIAYTDQSQYADEINSDNWYEVLTRDGVIYGHSDPDADPCGYRTLLVWQLAEKHYGVPGLYDKLDEHCPPENVRPKSVELIVLLESGDMDYAWEYRSVAVQHGMEFVELPDEINLSMVEHADFYSQATVEIAGKEPGTTMTMGGAPIVYGVTIPKNAPSPDLALEFVKFLLGPEGQAIMEGQGQPPIVPAVAGDVDKVPDELKDMVVPPAQTAALQAKADLNITGAVENELSLMIDDLKGMDVVEITAEHPKKGQETYQGVRLNDLLDMAKPKAEAATLSMVADDGYSADVVLSDAQACTDCLVAFQTEGGLRTVMPGMPSNVWVKGVIEIAIK
jgi:molybdate/tungstate transport system substrate-binding protein